MHPPRDGRGPADPPAERRVGLILFWLYVLLYGGFMALVLVRPDLLSVRPFGGVNLAIAYGMGLIASAFLLAVVYMVLRSGR
ncbi:MAG: DUF485 domain-containing protein [Planctomycetia bacterium]|nr:DUF485 domain-containing protein [Planctomycetia bacterium]